ncbi:MAG: hypothetical protein ACREF8_05980, partial [Chthoniobacterales bacterium]
MASRPISATPNAAGSGETATGDVRSRAGDFIRQKWDDLKNAYTVYHMTCWESFLFYAGQSRIEPDSTRKIYQPQQVPDNWTPQPQINRFSPAADAISANFGA